MLQCQNILYSGCALQIKLSIFNMLIYAIQGNGINMKRRLIIMCERKLCDINALVKFAFGGVYLFLALMLL